MKKYLLFLCNHFLFIQRDDLILPTRAEGDSDIITIPSHLRHQTTSSKKWYFLLGAGHGDTGEHIIFSSWCLHPGSSYRNVVLTYLSKHVFLHRTGTADTFIMTHFHYILMIECTQICAGPASKNANLSFNCSIFSQFCISSTFQPDLDPEAHSQSDHCITCFRFAAARAELAS